MGRWLEARRRATSRLDPGEVGPLAGEGRRQGQGARHGLLAARPVQGQAGQGRRRLGRHDRSPTPAADRAPADAYDAGMRLPVALVQLDASDDVDANIATAATLAAEAAAGGARLVALPEYLQFRGPDDGFRASARPDPGTASRTPSPRSPAGTTPGSSWAASPRRPVTRPAPQHERADRTRRARSPRRYRKIHLFDVAVDDGPGRHGVGAGHGRRGAGRRRRRWRRRGPVDLLRPALPRAVSIAGAGRRRGPDRPGQLHRADRARSLGGAAPRSGDRERRLGPRAVADRWAAGLSRRSAAR